MGGDYKLHFHSLVKWLKDRSQEIAADLDIPLPHYVNLDAHGQEEELPKADVVGSQQYALVLGAHETQVFIAFTVSTWNDKDLVRLVEIADRLAERLKPGSKIPLWTHDGVQLHESSWMVVTDDVDVEPVARGTKRTFVSLSLRLLSGRSGHRSA